MTVYTLKRQLTYYKLFHVLSSILVVLSSTIIPHIAYFRAIKSSFYYHSGIPIAALAILESITGLPLYFRRPYKITGPNKKFLKKIHKFVGFLTWFGALR